MCIKVRSNDDGGIEAEWKFWTKKNGWFLWVLTGWKGREMQINSPAVRMKTIKAQYYLRFAWRYNRLCNSGPLSSGFVNCHIELCIIRFVKLKTKESTFRLHYNIVTIYTDDYSNRIRICTRTSIDIRKNFFF